MRTATSSIMIHGYWTQILGCGHGYKLGIQLEKEFRNLNAESYLGFNAFSVSIGLGLIVLLNRKVNP